MSGKKEEKNRLFGVRRLELQTLNTDSAVFCWLLSYVVVSGVQLMSADHRAQPVEDVRIHVCSAVLRKRPAFTIFFPHAHFKYLV